MGQSGSLLEIQARGGKADTHPHPPPGLGWEEGKGRGGEEEMELHTGKKKPAGTGALLAKATEGDKPKVIPVF